MSKVHGQDYDNVALSKVAVNHRGKNIGTPVFDSYIETREYTNGSHTDDASKGNPVRKVRESMSRETTEYQIEKNGQLQASNVSKKPVQQNLATKFRDEVVSSFEANLKDEDKKRGNYSVTSVDYSKTIEHYRDGYEDCKDAKSYVAKKSKAIYDQNQARRKDDEKSKEVMEKGNKSQHERIKNVEIKRSEITSDVKKKQSEMIAKIKEELRGESKTVDAKGRKDAVSTMKSKIINKDVIVTSKESMQKISNHQIQRNEQNKKRTRTSDLVYSKELGRIDPAHGERQPGDVSPGPGAYDQSRTRTDDYMYSKELGKINPAHGERQPDDVSPGPGAYEHSITCTEEKVYSKKHGLINPIHTSKLTQISYPGPADYSPKSGTNKKDKIFSSQLGKINPPSPHRAKPDYSPGPGQYNSVVTRRGEEYQSKKLGKINKKEREKTSEKTPGPADYDREVTRYSQKMQSANLGVIHPYSKEKEAVATPGPADYDREVTRYSQKMHNFSLGVIYPYHTCKEPEVTPGPPDYEIKLTRFSQQMNTDALGNINPYHTCKDLEVTPGSPDYDPKITRYSQQFKDTYLGKINPCDLCVNPSLAKSSDLSQFPLKTSKKSTNLQTSRDNAKITKQQTTSARKPISNINKKKPSVQNSTHSFRKESNVDLQPIRSLSSRQIQQKTTRTSQIKEDGSVIKSTVTVISTKFKDELSPEKESMMYLTNDFTDAAKDPCTPADRRLDSEVPMSYSRTENGYNNFSTGQRLQFVISDSRNE